MKTRIVKDSGWPRWLLRLVQKKQVTVGIHQKRANRSKKKAGASRTNVQIGTIHEFGSGKIPQRSFLRSTYDENLPKYKEYFERAYARATKAKKKVDVPLRLVGLKIASDVRRKIDAGIPPPNAPSTVKRKGSSKPLIDTGALKRSIGYEVKT